MGEGLEGWDIPKGSVQDEGPPETWREAVLKAYRPNLKVRVADVPAPKGVCWKQGPLMDRCDRAQGHSGWHTWEMAGRTTVDKGGGVSMADELEQALAWYANPETKDLVVGLRHGHTLAAAVRELRSALSATNGMLDSYRHSPVPALLTERARKAEAALAEMRGRVCADCVWSLKHDASGEWLCNLILKPCYVVNHLCGAWAAKEQA